MAKRKANTKARDAAASRKAKQERRAKRKNATAIAAFSVAGVVFLALMVLKYIYL